MCQAHFLTKSNGVVSYLTPKHIQGFHQRFYNTTLVEDATVENTLKICKLKVCLNLNS